MIDVYTWWNTQEANWKNGSNIVLGPAERGYHIKALESSNCWMEVVHINGGTLCVQGCPKADFPTTNSISQIESSDPLSTNSWTRKGVNIFWPKIILTKPWSYFFLTNFMLNIPSLYIQLFPCRNLDSLWKPRTTLSWQCHTESLLVAISFYHHHKHLSADNCSLIVAKNRDR